MRSTTASTISGAGCGDGDDPRAARRRRAGDRRVGRSSASWSRAPPRAMAIAPGTPDGADHHVDLVLLDQLARVAAGGGRVGGVVEQDQLNLLAADGPLVLVRRPSCRARKGCRATSRPLSEVMKPMVMSACAAGAARFRRQVRVGSESAHRVLLRWCWIGMPRSCRAGSPNDE